MFFPLDPFNLDHNLAASIGTRSKCLISMIVLDMLHIIYYVVRLYILERFHIALFEHSQNVIWKNVVSLSG